MGSDSASSTLPVKHVTARRRVLRTLLIVLIVITGALVLLRLYLPMLVRDYVNRTLDQSELYRGRIGDIDIALWKGSYSIHDLRLNKMTGDVPVPLFRADRVDLAVQWDALLQGKVVGQIVVNQPQLNFVDSPDAASSQTGQGGPWLQIVRDLFPFKINSVLVHDGSVHFRTYSAKRPVDVYLSELEASVDDLGNIQDLTAPLITTVTARAMAMDQAKFQLQVRLDPFSYRPTFHLAMRLLGLDVTKVNDLALAYGQFDFKRGWFDLVVEADANEGSLSGYIKPLFRNLVLFSLPEDVQHDNPLQFFWQAVLGVGELVLKNQPRDQFGTFIPFSGDATATSPDIIATIGNVLRNGFVRAYLPKLQPGAVGADDQSLHFDAPEVSDPVSAGDSDHE